MSILAALHHSLLSTLSSVWCFVQKWKRLGAEGKTYQVTMVNGCAFVGVFA